MRAMERASGRSLTKWADIWIRRRGMPQVEVAWSCAGAKLRRLTVSQKDVLGEGGVWPIAMQVLLSQGSSSEQLRVSFDTPSTEVREAAGKPCPSYIFANAQDFAYGRFVLDPRAGEQ